MVRWRPWHRGHLVLHRPGHADSPLRNERQQYRRARADLPGPWWIRLNTTECVTRCSIAMRSALLFRIIHGIESSQNLSRTLKPWPRYSKDRTDLHPQVHEIAKRVRSNSQCKHRFKTQDSEKRQWQTFRHRYYGGKGPDCELYKQLRFIRALVRVLTCKVKIESSLDRSRSRPLSYDIIDIKKLVSDAQEDFTLESAKNHKVKGNICITRQTWIPAW